MIFNWPLCNLSLQYIDIFQTILDRVGSKRIFAYMYLTDYFKPTVISPAHDITNTATTTTTTTTYYYYYYYYYCLLPVIKNLKNSWDQNRRISDFFYSYVYLHR